MNTLRWIRICLFIAGPLLVAGIGGWIYYKSLGHVSTEDAYVKADMVSISPEVSGRIVKVDVSENEPVKQGQVLFELDNGTYRAGLYRTNAQLDAIRNQVEADKAEYRQRTEELDLAKANAAYAARELHRLKELKKQRAVSDSVLDSAQHDLDVARHKVSVLKQQRAGVLARLAGDPDLPVEKAPAYKELLAQQAIMQTSLARCVVHAPFDGIASKTPLPGQYAAAGSPVMSVVSTRNVWIEANFKETDLTDVKAGQPAIIHVDSYPNHVFEGKVDSISQATGGEFSILPPQNATGNWVKVVQRIPVRIKVISRFDDAPLRAGTSTSVDIETGRLPTLGSVAGR